MNLSRLSVSGLFAAAISLAAFSAASAWPLDFTPLAPAVDQPGHKEWTWNGGSGLSLGVPATVHYQRSGAPRIVITGPEEALRRVRVGEGHIGREESWIGSFGDERLEVIVTGVALDRISIGGSGKVLLGRLDQDRLDLNIGGSGSISGEGRIDRVQVNIGGSGKVDLARAVSTEASIRIGGSGDVDVAPRENASVSIAGSGSVRLAVRPEHLHSKVAGSGRILLPNKDGGYTDAVQMTRGMSRVDY